MRAVPAPRWLRAASLLAWFVAATAVATPALDPVAIGAGIYERGELASRAPLRGVYGSGTRVTGPAAACTSCHRPSGLGGVEGAVGIPPITGQALFGGGDPVVVRMDRRLEETAADLLANLPEADLADVIYRYGEEHASRRIARQIVRRRIGLLDRGVVQPAKIAQPPARRIGRRQALLQAPGAADLARLYRHGDRRRALAV